MIQHAVTLSIARPVPEVFAFLADVARTPSWLSRCVSLTRKRSGPLTMGEPLEYTYREGSRTGVMAGTVAVLEPDRKLEFHYLDRMLQVQVGFECSAEGSGTALRHHIQIVPLTLLMKLLQPVIRMATVKQTAKDMATLKSLLERK